MSPHPHRLRPRLRAWVHAFFPADRNLRLFLLANLLLGVGMAMDQGSFNNYLKDVFRLDVAQRTFLEFPRETPGFMVSLTIGLLYALGDVRIAGVAALLAGLGMGVLGIIPPEYRLMLLVVFVYSTGQHLQMPVSHSIGMAFAKDGKLGATLGRISAANTLALVSSAGLLLLVQAFWKPPYWLIFGVGSLGFLGAALCLFRMDRHHVPPLTQRFVVRREYSLYYFLSLLWGARKQLFLTFAPWVIVDVFNQPLGTMVLLFFAISVLGIFLKPWVGRLVDTVGERRVLAVESLIITAVCLVYAFAADLLPGPLALVIICIAYILDQSSSWVSMARATWLKKTAHHPSHVSPTLSLGISIDHISSMFIPMLGGWVWHATGSGGYRWVFLGGSLIALVNLVATRGIRVPKNQD